MGKLKTKGEFPDYQQKKHDAFVKAGFKLVKTKRSKDGMVRRVYKKIKSKSKSGYWSGICIGESSKEYSRQVKYFEEVVGRITKGSCANLFVLTTVLKELPKLKKGKAGVGFDFGTKKEWELRRRK